MNGSFIVFEGLDGCGKGTQIRLFAEYLARCERQFLLTHEPTEDTSAGQRIRAILAHREEAPAPLELQKLYVEDRAWHTEHVIKPALARGAVVVSDRYYHSTVAFGSLGVPIADLIALNQPFLQLPALTIIFNVQPAICLARIDKRGTEREFFEKAEKLSRAAKAYATVPSLLPNTVIIDGERPPEIVHRDVVSLSEGKI